MLQEDYPKMMLDVKHPAYLLLESARDILFRLEMDLRHDPIQDKKSIKTCTDAVDFLSRVIPQFQKEHFDMAKPDAAMG